MNEAKTSHRFRTTVDAKDLLPALDQTLKSKMQLDGEWDLTVKSGHGILSVVSTSEECENPHIVSGRVRVPMIVEDGSLQVKKVVAFLVKGTSTFFLMIECSDVERRILKSEPASKNLIGA